MYEYAHAVRTQGTECLCAVGDRHGVSRQRRGCPDTKNVVDFQIWDFLGVCVYVCDDYIFLIDNFSKEVPQAREEGVV